jgi:hypothetical protein
MATTKRNRRGAASKPAVDTAAERVPAAADMPETPALIPEAPANPSEAPTQVLATPAPQPSIPDPQLAHVPAPPADVPAPAPAAPEPRAPAAPTFGSDHGSPRAPTALNASLAQERAALTQRRAIAVGAVALIVVLAGLLAYQLLTPRANQVAAPVAAPTAASAPAAAANPTAAPAVLPTAAPAPAAAADPTAAPAVLPTVQPAPVVAANPTAAPQQGAATGAITCSAIAGLPVFDGATCTDQDTDVENNVTKLENTYSTPAKVDDIRRFYEGAFAQNGWNVGEFTYQVELGARRLTIEVDTDQGVSGAFTKVKLIERGAPPATGTTCVQIAGLAVAPNATCIDFDTDQDNGVFETESTYSTTASPQEVWRFYESALAQSGWAAQEAKYEVGQGQRRVQITVDTDQGAQAAFTEFKIAEQ